MPTREATPTGTGTPTITPTATQVTVIPPANGPDTYRLKPWNQAAALRILKESERVPIAEEYQDMREFYQLSIIEEIWHAFPYLRNDPEINKRAAEIKGLNYSYNAPYGLLHDYSVEPLRRMIELSLNDEDTGLKDLSRLEGWIDRFGNPDIDPISNETSNLFPSPIPARVIQISGAVGWNFFVIRADRNGQYSVFAIYPEWKRYWWNSEIVEITDLNANGVEEIAITYDGWGSGMAHFCDKGFKLYEWDGSDFRDLMADPLEFFANTDYGNCLEITFLPDNRGVKKIQAGTSLYILCPTPYSESSVTYSWNGKAYKKDLGYDLPAPDGPPDPCTIDWALIMGPERDEAVDLLKAALEDWPVEANDEWGPAAQDFLSLRLAAWYMKRGQAKEGLDLLAKLRFHPAVPEYSIPARAAAIFLDTYAAQGWYRAAWAVEDLYYQESLPFCGNVGCDVMAMKRVWGFREREWDFLEYGLYDHKSDFISIDSMALSLKQTSPGSLNALLVWLEQNQLRPLWSMAGDFDGQGDQDWVVEVESQYFDSTVQAVYAFLRQNGQVKPVKFSSHLGTSDGKLTGSRQWQSLRLASPPGVVNVFQDDYGLYAFHLEQKGAVHEIKEDFRLVLRSPNVFYRKSLTASDQSMEVKGWYLADNQLVVQYEDREAVYTWDTAHGTLVPTGYAPELQEEHVREIEQALYRDDDPVRAMEILKELLSAQVWENYVWESGEGITNPPRLRPYMMYLLGLAYEQSGDAERAARAYWQLWRDFPASPYSLAAQSKLEHR